MIPTICPQCGASVPPEIKALYARVERHLRPDGTELHLGHFELSGQFAVGAIQPDGSWAQFDDDEEFSAWLDQGKRYWPA